MTTVGLEEAKARLEELLEVAATGEKIVITKPDGSAFELVPKARAGRRGGLGRAAGRIWLADDFDSIPDGFEDYLP